MRPWKRLLGHISQTMTHRPPASPKPVLGGWCSHFSPAISGIPKAARNQKWLHIPSSLRVPKVGRSGYTALGISGSKSREAWLDNPCCLEDLQIGEKSEGAP